MVENGLGQQAELARSSWTRRLAKYAKTASMAASGYIGDSPLFMFDYLMRVLRVLVLLSIWRIVLSEEGASGLSLQAVLTYTLISEVFFSQLNPRTSLEDAFWQGSIAGRMAQPLGLFEQFTSEAVGRWFFEWCCFSIPLLLISPWLGVNVLPASAGAGLLFIVSLLLAISVGLALEYIFCALLVIWQLPMWAMLQMRSAVITLLSGAMLPLAFLPDLVGEIFSWLPFASMASAPLQIYVGAGNSALLLGLQIVWSLLLWPLAHWLWFKGREGMISYGG